MDMFPDAPRFPPSLPDDEISLLAKLPDWDTVTKVDEDDEPAARRLEKRGLIKMHRWKDDDLAIRPTMYAGKLETSKLTLLT